MKVGPLQLRFRLEETIQLVSAQFGTAANHETAVKIHALTEGWPLGLQFILSNIARGGSSQSEVAAFEKRGETSHNRLLALLLANLEASDAEFLTRIAILDELHPELCEFVIGSGDTAARLEDVSSATPVFPPAEHSEWFKMHSLVREEFRRRFAALPYEEQTLLHRRASAWLSDHGNSEAAASHAFAAGQTERAYELAERSLYEAFFRGRQEVVQNWLGRLVKEELDKRPRLLLAAAWSLALSERHGEASDLVSRISLRVCVDFRRRGCVCR